MGDIKSYKDLEVWQKAIGLVKDIYFITNNFPKEEVYGLTNQMRRSAISIASNIAEGFMRQHTNEMVQFLYVALGSYGELDTQLIVAKDLGFVDAKINLNLGEKLDHIARMIRNLIKSLRSKRITNHEQRNTNHEQRTTR